MGTPVSYAKMAEQLEMPFGGQQVWAHVTKYQIGVPGLDPNAGISNFQEDVPGLCNIPLDDYLHLSATGHCS